MGEEALDSEWKDGVILIGGGGVSLDGFVWTLLFFPSGLMMMIFADGGV